jgi:hypothetical protein
VWLALSPRPASPAPPCFRVFRCHSRLRECKSALHLRSVFVPTTALRAPGCHPLPCMSFVFTFGAGFDSRLPPQFFNQLAMLRSVLRSVCRPVGNRPRCYLRCGLAQLLSNGVSVAHRYTDVPVPHVALLNSNWRAQLIQPRTITVPQAVRRNVPDTRILTRPTQLLPKGCVAPWQSPMLLR